MGPTIPLSGSATPSGLGVSGKKVADVSLVQGSILVPGSSSMGPNLFPEHEASGLFPVVVRVSLDMQSREGIRGWPDPSGLPSAIITGYQVPLFLHLMEVL